MFDFSVFIPVKKMFDEQDLEIATDYIGISLICPVSDWTLKTGT